RKEVRLNLPAMLQAAELLQQQGDYEFILPVASTLSKEWLSEQLTITGWSRPLGLRSEPEIISASAAEVRTKGPRIHLTNNARTSLMHARASVVASGTATVEAALSGTPFVVVYRLAPLTWLLGRRLVKLDTFAMANLIAGKKVVPALIQKDFTAANVVRELQNLLPDGPDRQKMQAALKMVQQRLHDSQSVDPPALRAAREVLA